MTELKISAPAGLEGVVNGVNSGVSNPIAGTSSSSAVSEALSGAGSQGGYTGDGDVLNKTPANNSAELENAFKAREEASLKAENAEARYNKTLEEYQSKKDAVLKQKEIMEKAEKARNEASKLKTEAEKAVKSATNEKEAAKALAKLKDAKSKYIKAKDTYKTAARGYNDLAKACNKFKNGTLAAVTNDLKSAQKAFKLADKKFTNLGGTPPAPKNTPKSTPNQEVAKPEAAKQEVAKQNTAKEKQVKQKTTAKAKKSWKFPKINLNHKALGPMILLGGLALSALIICIGNAGKEEKTGTNNNNLVNDIGLTDNNNSENQIEEKPLVENEATISVNANANASTNTNLNETSKQDVSVKETNSGNQEDKVITNNENSNDDVISDFAIVNEEELDKNSQQEETVLHIVKKGDNLWNIVKDKLTQRNDGAIPSDKEIMEGVGRMMKENGLHWESDGYVVLIYPEQKLNYKTL